MEKGKSSTKESVEELARSRPGQEEEEERQEQQQQLRRSQERWGGTTGSLLLFHHQMADSSSSANAKCSDGVSYFDSSLKGKMTSHNNSSNNSSSSSSGGGSGPGGAGTSGAQTTMVDRLKLLYPNVNETVDPLPRSWSSQDKCTTIGLTQNNLRVHYKGFYAHFFLPFTFPHKIMTNHILQSCLSHSYN